MASKQNQSTNIVPSEYVKNMEMISKLAGFDHQNAIVFSVLLGEFKELEKKFAKIKEVVDDLENRVDTIFSSSFREPLRGKEYNSSDSDTEEETTILAEACIPKKMRIYPGKKKVKQ